MGLVEKNTEEKLIFICVTLSDTEGSLPRQANSLTQDASSQGLDKFVERMSLLSMTRHGLVGGLYHSKLRSFHWGFIDSINAIFFERSQPLICFSRASAT